MSHKVFIEDYYKNRNLNDKKRHKAFKSEKQFLNKYISKGALLDVGCSTGEMLEAYEWTGEKFGMEISNEAIELAKKRNIKFEKDLFNSNNFFDCIIFRGTIQHIDTPFLYLKKSYTSLKKGGKVAFFATPNANSIYFKIWGTLPFLDLPSTNFFIPHDKWLIQAMENIGFKLIDKRYPYWNSPYRRFVSDHIKFILKILGLNVEFSFWRNSMDLIFVKP